MDFLQSETPNFLHNNSTNKRKQEEHENGKFCKKIKEELQRVLRDVKDIEIKEVRKNNGVQLTGLTFIKRVGSVHPTVYLNSFKSRYEEEKIPFDTIVAEIADAYQNADVPVIDLEYVRNWEEVKDDVVFKLINTEKNASYLQDIPHAEIMDLSMVFYIPVQCMGGSIAVSQELFEMWGVDMDVLKQVAHNNVDRKCPVKITSMSEMLGFDTGTPMYVITNNDVFGASAMLDAKALGELADQLESDLMILPSSVHEVIAVPANREAEGLRQMVTEINATQVAPDEVLSDSVYLFNRENGTLSIAE